MTGAVYVTRGSGESVFHTNPDCKHVLLAREGGHYFARVSMWEARGMGREQECPDCKNGTAQEQDQVFVSGRQVSRRTAFHTSADCEHVRRLRESGSLLLVSSEDARAAGRRECKNCLLRRQGNA